MRGADRGRSAPARRERSAPAGDGPQRAAAVAFATRTQGARARDAGAPSRAPAEQPSRRRATRAARTLGALAWLLLAGALGACAKSDEAWREDLHSRDPYVRGLAAIGLALQSPREAAPALPVLFETIDRAQTGLELEAAQALVLVGPEHVDALLDELITNPLMTDQRRGTILNALVAAGGRAARPITERLAGDGREQAGDLGEVLLAIGAPAAPAIGALLDAEGDVAPRRFAAFLLVKLGPRARAARPALERALEAQDAELRALAEQALGGLRPPRRSTGGPARGPATGPATGPARGPETGTERGPRPGAPSGSGPR